MKLADMLSGLNLTYRIMPFKSCPLSFQRGVLCLEKGKWLGECNIGSSLFDACCIRGTLLGAVGKTVVVTSCYN